MKEWNDLQIPVDKRLIVVPSLKRIVSFPAGNDRLMLQRYDLTLEDFQQLEGCNEILNLTRPDIVRAIHDAYFEVGVDAVETNTFGANLSALGEYGIADQITVITANGIMLRTNVQGISRYGRTARGVRIVNLNEGDSVAAVAVLNHEDLNRGVDDGGGGDLGAPGAAAQSNGAAARENAAENAAEHEVEDGADSAEGSEEAALEAE